MNFGQTETGISTPLNVSSHHHQQQQQEDVKSNIGSKVTLNLDDKVIIRSDFVDRALQSRTGAKFSASDLTLIKKLALTRNDNPHRELDERRQQIREKMKKQFREAPKSFMEKALENKTGVEKALEETDKKMEDIIAFGDELVSNIKVANEKRELMRREFESSQRANLEQDLRKESIESMARYEDITSRWSELDSIKEPMTMFEQMEEQKERIRELMQRKDDMIAQCQREIERMNERYDVEQRRQYDDLCCLVERIDNQVDLLRQAYNHHLNLLETTIEDERKTMALAASSKFDEFYQRMDDGENMKIDIMKEKKEFYANEIERITRQQEEITRATRIRLEKDAEMLQWEVRNTKNQVLMNSEKLDYNYQVLQKRNDENAIVSNQQKRRIGKLRESISELKRRIQTSTAKSEATAGKLSADIEKLHGSISELEKKRLNFRLANKKKFFGVWDINFQEVKELITKIFDIDRILHEQQLNMPWQQPVIDLSEHPEIVKMRRTKAEASELPTTLDRIMRPLTMSAVCKTTALCTASSLKSVTKRKDEQTAATLAEKRSSVRFLRNILRQISDRSGFLVEEKLMDMLQPYTDEQKTLVRIDHIFDALRIRDLKTITSLIDHFKPYSYCPNCMSGVAKSQMHKLFSANGTLLERVGSENDDASTAEEGTVSSSTSSGSSPLSTPSTCGTLVPSPPSNGEGHRKSKRCPDHYLAIEPAFVLTALNDLTLKQSQQQRKALGHSASAPHDSNERAEKINLIEIDNDAIQEYWQKFLTFIPENTERLWSNLEHGLTHYLEVLKKREQLDTECSALKRQNEELKFLLHKFNK